MHTHTLAHLFSRRTLLVLLSASATLLAGGCTSISGATRTDFDGPLLNATWYGAYYRPVPDAEARPAPPAPVVAAASTTAPAPVTTAPAQPAPAVQAAVAAPPPMPAVAAPAARPPAAPAPDGDYQPELAAAYIAAVYTLNETSVGPNPSSIVDIYRHVQNNGQIYHTSRPAAGDLVFFHNTVDRNGDGRNNDWYTHIGIVEDVADNGTVSVLSYVGNSVSRLQLNLEQPTVATVGSQSINSTLRQRRSSDPEHTQYLASELFAGFGSLLGDRAEVMVLDTWSPTQELASR